MKYKQERIKVLIVQEILNTIIMGEVKDPRIPKIITITHITLSKDLHYCHLYFSMLGDDAQKMKAVHGLNNASGFFQKVIGEKLKLRFTPKIEFRYDEKEEEAFRVYNLLKKIEEERLDKSE